MKLEEESMDTPDIKPLIKQKDYSEKEYGAKRKKSFQLAKRIVVTSELMSIALGHALLALLLFFLFGMGTDLLPEFLNIAVDFSADSFMLQGGLFIRLSCICVLLFALFGILFAFEYKQLEIMCIHLYGEESSRLKFDKTNQKGGSEKGANLNPKKYGKFGGPAWVANTYLNNNGQSPLNINIFKVVNILLVVAQIICAVVCVIMLLK